VGQIGHLMSLRSLYFRGLVHMRAVEKFGNASPMRKTPPRRRLADTYTFLGLRPLVDKHYMREQLRRIGTPGPKIIGIR
jgi:hypothetical protein